MLGLPKDEVETDPTLEQQFFIGGWDPYVVEITRLKRDKSDDSTQQISNERRHRKDRRKS